MENYARVRQWKFKEFEIIYYKIRIAIDELDKQKLSRAGIRLSIPAYFVELMQRANNLEFCGVKAPLDVEDDEITMFGCKITPAFENFIVVYHLDSPAYKDSTYSVIDLQ